MAKTLTNLQEKLSENKEHFIHKIISTNSFRIYDLSGLQTFFEQFDEQNNSDDISTDDALAIIREILSPLDTQKENGNIKFLKQAIHSLQRTLPENHIMHRINFESYKEWGETQYKLTLLP